MRTAVMGLLMSLAAAACLASEPDGGDAVDQASAEEETAEEVSANEVSDDQVEEILDNPLADDDYREERSCLRRRTIDDESLVVFRGRIKNRVWVNRLTQPCVGLRRDMVVTTHARTGSICKFDTMDARARGSGPFERPVRCYLGGFEAIDEVQVEAMKRAVDEHAKASRKPDKTSN